MTRASVWPGMDEQQAVRFASLALANLGREYPSKLDQVLDSAGDIRSPRALHPAFFGCYDWHSAVHAHWLLARILRLHPGLPQQAAILAALDASLTAANIVAEVAYLARPSARAFERTYGWAWAFKLHQELRRLASAGAIGQAPAWADAVEPLAGAFAARYTQYLPRLTYPIRTGVHPNTAFGLMFAHDWAVDVGHAPLHALVESRARECFGSDTDAPARFEPSGTDFFSPALLEADLMRRVLAPAEFTAWLSGWLPGLARGQPARFVPALVSDRTDPQIVHLDGLNLSRAWSLRAIASAVSVEQRQTLLALASRNQEASIQHVASGDYAGEHWLATFAALALTGS